MARVNLYPFTRTPFIAVFTLFATFCLTATISTAQTFRTLVVFQGANGANPGFTPLIQGEDGSLHGVTRTGGMGDGTLFKMTAQGKLRTIYSFICCGGILPAGGLLLNTDGIYFGTTQFGGNNVTCQIQGGCGTIFGLRRDGALTTLHTFNGSGDGALPVGVLLQAVDGNIYGTTPNGGDLSCNPPYGCGTVFKMTPSGEFTTLHIFEGPDGESPYGGLIQASDGSFYGTTNGGALKGFGTVFKINPRGTLTTLYRFSGGTDGGSPYAALLLASDANLYGTTRYNTGTIFRLTLGGALTTLHTFEGLSGDMPDGTLLQATDGNLYGTAYSGGTENFGVIYSVSLTGTFTILHNFKNTDGANPTAGLYQATNGRLYGTTTQGGDLECGSTYGCGTMFSLDMGFDSFVAFVHGIGKIGQTFEIIGQGFTGSTTVTLNGTPASFTVVSDTFIKATVPAGATTGYVTVATPTGTLTSNVPFHVIP